MDVTHAPVYTAQSHSTTIYSTAPPSIQNVDGYEELNSTVFLTTVL